MAHDRPNLAPPTSQRVVPSSCSENEAAILKRPRQEQEQEEQGSDRTTAATTTASLETTPAGHFRLTRDACDTCSRKKRKCTGEKPCSRCERAGVECTYSVRTEAGRGRKGGSARGHGGQQQTTSSGGGSSSKRQRGGTTTAFTLSTARPAFSISPATGLAGLAESRYLSCFLEHVAPMYPVADDASIRDGLMHEFVAAWNSRSHEALRGSEAMRGQALSCALFSCMAIGGLIMGCPPTAVAHHMTSARSRLAKFSGLSDRSSVSALILYGLSHEFLPQQGASAEYLESVEKARAIFEGLPDKDPLLSAVLAFLTVLNGVPLLQHVETTSSVNPVNDAACVRNTGTSYLCTRNTNDESTFQRALQSRAEAHLISTQHSPPVYVAADALLLSIRFSRDRGDVSTRLRHLHDFAASEMNRLIRAQSGVVAVLSLIGTLLGVQIRLGQPDGMLAAAELTSALLHKCPGLARSYHCHAAHLSLAAFRLHGRREAYDILRDLLIRMAGSTPTFEELRPGVPICELSVCAMTAEKLLKMGPPGRVDAVSCRSPVGASAVAARASCQPDRPSAASRSRQRALTLSAPPPRRDKREGGAFPAQPDKPRRVAVPRSESLTVPTEGKPCSDRPLRCAFGEVTPVSASVAMAMEVDAMPAAEGSRDVNNGSRGRTGSDRTRVRGQAVARAGPPTTGSRHGEIAAYSLRDTATNAAPGAPAEGLGAARARGASRAPAIFGYNGRPFSVIDVSSPEVVAPTTRTFGGNVDSSGLPLLGVRVSADDWATSLPQRSGGGGVGGGGVGGSGSRISANAANTGGGGAGTLLDPLSIHRAHASEMAPMSGDARILQSDARSCERLAAPAPAAPTPACDASQADPNCVTGRIGQEGNGCNSDDFTSDLGILLGVDGYSSSGLPD